MDSKSRTPPLDLKYLRCVTSDMVSVNKRTGKVKLIKDPVKLDHPRGLLADFFFGVEFNPRLFGVDIKMFLYTIGAVQLQINIISFFIVQFHRYHVDKASILYTFQFTWFLLEYCFFEHVHLYTYDLFAEKIGFKLLWGCICFYPFFYGIGGYIRVPGLDVSRPTAMLLLALFVTGWILTRGANMQKYYFKRYPDHPTVFWGLIEQRAIRKGSRILTSGFWGISRHVNYLGEILQSLSLSFLAYAVMPPDSLVRIVPFLYTIYYILLFVPRERDDHLMCLAKYGKDWELYCEQTPYRIVTFIY